MEVSDLEDTKVVIMEGIELVVRDVAVEDTKSDIIERG